MLKLHSSLVSVTHVRNKTEQQSTFTKVFLHYKKNTSRNLTRLIFETVQKLSKNKKYFIVSCYFTDTYKIGSSKKVLEAGIEPALPKKLDFESSASTNSATRALLFYLINFIEIK